MDRRSPTPGAGRKRAAIERLKRGLDEDRLVLHYQPIVAARDARIVGAEALLRWRDDREPDDLDELVWSAERSPIIAKLESWTLGQACRDAAGWRAAGVDAGRVDVNVSARDFPRPDLVELVERQLETCGLDPHTLALEITETSGIRDFDAGAEQIETLTAMGLELWLDDFGTGHSSLEWLRRLTCHGVKIPGSFMEGVVTDERSRAIVTRVVELAHDLELLVVAEGVETPAQRDLLVRLGCDRFQGFLFHAPMAAADLAAALAGTGRPSDTLRA